MTVFRGEDFCGEDLCGDDLVGDLGGDAILLGDEWWGDIIVAGPLVNTGLLGCRSRMGEGAKTFRVISTVAARVCSSFADWKLNDAVVGLASTCLFGADETAKSAVSTPRRGLDCEGFSMVFSW